MRRVERHLLLVANKGITGGNLQSSVLPEKRKQGKVKPIPVIGQTSSHGELGTLLSTYCLRARFSGLIKMKMILICLIVEFSWSL